MQLDIDIKKTLCSGKRTFDLRVQFKSEAQRIVIYGPSGSGKSLTLKAIAGLMHPDNGHIRLGYTTLFDSTALIHLKPQQRRTGYLFQDYALFPHLNVRQNIGFGLKQGWFNPRRNDANKAIEYWLDAFDLQYLAHQLPEELSGGQRQRTALARALVTQPQILLLDEPFTSLDAALRSTMRAELDTLQKRLDVPMIMITHDPEDARIFGDEVLHLSEGKINGTGEIV